MTEAPYSSRIVPLAECEDVDSDNAVDQGHKALIVQSALAFCTEQDDILQSCVAQAERIKDEIMLFHRETDKIRQEIGSDFKIESNKVSIELKAVANGENFFDFSRRLYTTIFSSEFYSAVKERDVARCVKIVCSEFSIYLAVNYAFRGTKKYVSILYEAVEEYFQSAFKLSPTTKSIFLGVLMILIGFFLTPSKNRKTWSQLGFILAQETLKAATILYFSWFISIPASLAIDSIAEEYRVRAARGESFPLARSILGVATSFTFYVLGVFIKPAEQVSPDRSYPDEPIDSIFECPLTYQPLVDPVFLHGMPFSRSSITEAIRRRANHPFTQAKVHPSEIVEARPDFLKYYVEYMNRRADLIEERRRVSKQTPR